MKVGTQSHPKFARLARRLNLPAYSVAGILELLWMLCVAGNRLDGDLAGYDSEDIAAYIGWDGDSQVLVDALVATGWLEVGGDGELIVHDYADHCPDYIKKRVKRKETADDGHRAGDSGHRAADNGDRCPVSVRATKASAQSQPNPTQPNPTFKKDSSLRSESSSSPPATGGKAKAAYSKSFEQFWSAYPRKSNKGAAAKAFDRAVKLVGTERELLRDESVAWLVETAKAYAASPEGRSQYAPHAHKWLTQRKYDDDRGEWQRARDGPKDRAANSGAVYDPEAAKRDPNHGKF